MPESDLALLREAALAAGEIARRFFKNDAQVWDKGDQGPVTEADLAIDAMLRSKLLAARPTYGWQSEESAAQPSKGRRSFVIDPIDGTRAFIEGNPDFTHALAVVEDGIPVAAAIHQPVRDRTWTAEKGGGAHLNRDPIAPSATTSLEGATLLAARPTMRGHNWRDTPPVKPAFRSSLAYRLALIAQGRFDTMLTLRPCWEWDIAAGALICTEAGASVTDRHGATLRFGNVSQQVSGVCAATPALHKPLLDRLVPSR